MKWGGDNFYQAAVPTLRESCCLTFAPLDKRDPLTLPTATGPLSSAAKPKIRAIS